MDDPARSNFRLVVADLPELRPGPGGVAFRTVEDDDDAELGGLMERAYAGTVDEDLGDNNDGLVEIEDWRSSGAVPECSIVALQDGGYVSACLIARAPSGNWWVGYVYTDPVAKGRGIGRAAAAQALALVRAAGATEVQAEVTDGNEPSERLLRSLGFTRTGPG
ncbi:RimJ/RimL family protein N-acetyltransferase [Nakamurella sp. UYEF19]|uniref:GNAT family N-acetyltransferase n=1 Tax=Nakamurella sp. UYEF19 TaxID=1756392 RepID=UPI0033953001